MVFGYFSVRKLDEGDLLGLPVHNSTHFGQACEVWLLGGRYLFLGLRQLFVYLSSGFCLMFHIRWRQVEGEIGTFFD